MRFRKFYRFLKVSSVLLAIYSLPKTTWALTFEDIGPQTGLTTVDLKPFLINIASFVLGIVGIVSLSMIIYGGALLMVAGGNEDIQERARRIITGAIIGIVLVLSSWTLFSTVFQGIAQAAG